MPPAAAPPVAVVHRIDVNSGARRARVDGSVKTRHHQARRGASAGHLKVFKALRPVQPPPTGQRRVFGWADSINGYTRRREFYFIWQPGRGRERGRCGAYRKLTKAMARGEKEIMMAAASPGSITLVVGLMSKPSKRMSDSQVLTPKPNSTAVSGGAALRVSGRTE